MAGNTLITLLNEMTQAINMLSDRLRTSEQTLEFLSSLGLDLSLIPDSIGTISSKVAIVRDRAQDLADALNENRQVDVASLNLATSIGEFVELILKVKESLDMDFAGDLTIPEDLGRRFLDTLIIDYLRISWPVIYTVLEFLGIIEIDYKSNIEDQNETDEMEYGDTSEDASGPDEAIIVTEPSVFLHKKINYDRFLLLFKNPAFLAKEIYKWGTFEFDSELLEWRSYAILRAIGITAYFRHVFLVPDNPEDDPIIQQQLRMPVLEVISETGAGEIGAYLGEAQATSDILPGIMLGPYVNGTSSRIFSIADNISIEFTSNLDLSGGLVMMARPPLALSFETSESATSVSGQLGLTWRYQRPSNTPVFIGPGPFEFLMEAIEASVEARLEGLNLEPFITFKLYRGQLAFGTDGADNFLARLIPKEGIRFPFDLGVAWAREGITIIGSAGFEVFIPLHVRLGPIELETVYISAALSTEQKPPFELKVGVNANSHLGPVAVKVQQIGIRMQLTLPDDRRGNLGPLNIQPRFLPPTGAGLSIDASGIMGGGFLEFDDPNKRYVGVLALNFGDIGLTAIGLITTQLPDGSEGYALLISIGIIFSPPIQLSFGFTLKGVGGLIAVNRSMNIDVLRERLRSGAADAIMFPENPIQNATQIISNLEAVFPVQQDRYIIGPMLKIGWGAQNLIEADIAVLIEVPDPVRVAILGSISAFLPRKNKILVELHLDVLGVIEFDKKTLAIDASLYNSRILTYRLTGDAAVRLNWGDNPQFALSLGGFHPRFSPPPAFPSLRRLSLNLSQGSKLQLSCWCYQALTSNSLQFGAGVDLYASYIGASLEGHVSFDTLIYFSPFRFEAGINGNVAVKFKGHRLASVGICLLLSGPTPWNARGKATFGILWWDIDVEFNETWGTSDAQAVTAVDPWNELKPALENSTSWGSRLPEKTEMIEALGESTNADGTVLVHPSGAIELKQTVLPLGVQLDKFGTAPVETHRSFDIASIVIGGAEHNELRAVEDYFARGQFKNLTNTERLSLPSFEKMKAGVVASSEVTQTAGEVEESPFGYETILINEDRTSEKGGKVQWKFPWQVASRHLQSAAAGRSALRNTGSRKFEIFGQGKKVGAKKDGYLIVERDDMSPVGDLPGNDGSMGRSQAEDALRTFCAQETDMTDKVQIVFNYEVAA